MAPWQHTSVQETTRVLKEWTLSFPAKKALNGSFSIDGYAEDFDLNALNILVVGIDLRGKLMNFVTS